MSHQLKLHGKPSHTTSLTAEGASSWVVASATVPPNVLATTNGQGVLSSTATKTDGQPPPILRLQKSPR